MMAMGSGGFLGETHDASRGSLILNVNLSLNAPLYFEKKLNGTFRIEQGQKNVLHSN